MPSVICSPRDLKYCRNLIEALYLRMQQPYRRHFGNRFQRGPALGESSNDGDESGTRHPPHLRGRDIGLWYAKRSKEKKPKEEKVQLVSLSDSVLNHMKQVVEDFKLGANEPARTSESGQVFHNLYLNHLQDSQLLHKLHGDEDDVMYSDNICRNEKFDEYAKLELGNRSQSYLDFRKSLPAFTKKEEIIESVKLNQTIVICGETGCGKTTQVPQFILDDFIENGNGSLCSIIVTQPRRISAISVAERVAEERNETCGDNSSVGYHIRLEKKLPKSMGSILFCTTGVVIKFLESDPLLSRTSHLIIDEIHERDLHSDLLLIIVKDILKQRPDLKLILMSATLNADQFSKYFDNCPMINIPGFIYPVEAYHLEDVLEKTGIKPECRDQFKKFPRRGKKQKLKEEDHLKNQYLESLKGVYSSTTINSLNDFDETEINIDFIKNIIKYICLHEKQGAILVFLPGWNQISDVNRALTVDRFYCSSKHLIIPLHSMMPTVNQRSVFDKPPNGIRKIILATNIAETSITINDVVFVVDCGKVKMQNYDSVLNIRTLQPEWISLANARQRRGRAGRVQPGVCYHLFTKHRESMLDAYPQPEILRVQLEELCLKIKMLKLGQVQEFINKALDPPDTLGITNALDKLKRMRALDEDENLTPLGFHLARLPIDPQIGKMILFGAIFSCLDPILTIASCISYKDAFVVPLGKEDIVDQIRATMASGCKSDLIMFYRAYEGWENAQHYGNEYGYCRENFLSISTLRMLKEMKNQLCQLLHEVEFVKSSNPKILSSNRNSNNLNLIRAVICSGLYPNVAKIKNWNLPRHSSKYPRSVKLLSKDGPVSLHLKSVNSKENYFESPYMMYHLKLKSTQVFLHDATMVSTFPLLLFGGEVNFTSNEGYYIITVDKWIKFRCAKETAKIINDFSHHLNQMLDHKINHPGIFGETNSREQKFLDAVIDLIATENSSDSETSCMDID